MPIITFISDFGNTDHYVASVKGSVLKYNPNNKIVDVSHEVNKYDLSHAAYIFKNVYKEFPQGSVHIIGVNNSDDENKIILFQLNNQYVITFDSGIISLLDSNENISVMEIEGIKHSSFPEKLMGEVASKLLQELTILLRKPISEFKQFSNVEVKITNNEIVGHSIRIDHYGNIITNITKSDFNKVLSKNSGSFEINLGIDKINKLSNSYSDVEIADLFALFNYNENLEIGMNRGNASNLLGIKNHTQISIKFL